MAWGRLDATAVLVWIALVGGATAWILFRWIASARTGRSIQGLFLDCALMLAPLAALVLSAATFGRGGHPTAQLSSDALWNLWFEAFLPLLLTCAGGVAGSVAVLTCRRRLAYRLARTHPGLALAANALSALLVMSNYPSA